MTWYQQVFSKYLLPLLTVLYVYFTPTLYWIGAVGFFITADMVIRILLCLRNGVPVMSSKMWRTAGKFGMALTFILVAYVSQTIFAPDMPFMKIIGTFFIILELKSLDEKAKEATGYSIFSLVVEKIIPKKS